LVKKTELTEFWKDASWAEQHYAELQSLYRNKWVGVIRGEVVAVGDTLGEVQDQAIQLAGEGVPAILYIESGAAIYSHTIL
jgi:hypothetical protein